MGYAIIADSGGIRLEGDTPFIGREIDEIRNQVMAAIDVLAIEDGLHIGYAKIDDTAVNRVRVSLNPEVLRQWGVEKTV